jgi:hypothetical protein
LVVLLSSFAEPAGAADLAPAQAPQLDQRGRDLARARTYQQVGVGMAVGGPVLVVGGMAFFGGLSGLFCDDCRGNRDGNAIVMLGGVATMVGLPMAAFAGVRSQHARPGQASDSLAVVSTGMHVLAVGALAGGLLARNAALLLAVAPVSYTLAAVTAIAASHGRIKRIRLPFAALRPQVRLVGPRGSPRVGIGISGRW